MADTDEDDCFSDDDLDALPSDAFLELQQDALRSTPQPTDRGQDGIHRTEVRGLTKGLELVHIKHQNTTEFEYPVQPSSDYGDLDEEMLDGEILDASTQPAITGQQGYALAPRLVSENTQREQWRQQLYGAPIPAQKLVQKPQEHQNLPQHPAAHGARTSAPETRDVPVMEVEDEGQAMSDESEELRDDERSEKLHSYVEKAWVDLHSYKASGHANLALTACPGTRRYTAGTGNRPFERRVEGR